MLIEEDIEISWHGKTRKHYESLGYIFTKKGDKFLVKNIELPPNSDYIIKYKCDECGCIFSIKLSKYNEKKYNIDLCKKCGQLNKYRNDNRQSIDLWNDIVVLFSNRGHVLLSLESEYKNIHSKLSYICKKHPSKIRSVSYRSYKQNKNCCPDCQIEGQTGNNSFHWKGGISAIGLYLRNKIYKWKRLSMEDCKFKCILTNKNFDDIHHLYPFNKILEKIFIETKIDKKVSILDYSDKELDTLIEKLEELHNKYPLGICLSENTHKLFHKLYGNRNNTPEQFYEFKKDFNDGKYKGEI